MVAEGELIIDNAAFDQMAADYNTNASRTASKDPMANALAQGICVIAPLWQLSIAGAPKGRIKLH